MPNKKQRGAGLVPVLIVVWIVGMLLTVVLPRHLKQKHEERLAECQRNLTTIGEAFNSWLLNHGKKVKPELVMKNRDSQICYFKIETLVSDGFLKEIPYCPEVGPHEQSVNEPCYALSIETKKGKVTSFMVTCSPAFHANNSQREPIHQALDYPLDYPRYVRTVGHQGFVENNPSINAQKDSGQKNADNKKK